MKTSGDRITFALTASRFALAPVLVIAAHIATSGRWIGLLVALGSFTDILDGVVARHSNASTVSGSRFDSIADTAFYFSAGYAALILRREELLRVAPLIALILTTQIVGHVLEVRRFGKAASHHSWSGKVWGVMLPIALIALFGWRSSTLLIVALLCGIISHVEGFFITHILPEWRHDVPSVVHAIRIRRAAREVSRPGV